MLALGFAEVHVGFGEAIFGGLELSGTVLVMIGDEVFEVFFEVDFLADEFGVVVP